MKKLLSKKIIYSFIIAIMAVASFCGGLSFAVSQEETNVVEEIVYETPELIEEDVNDYIYDEEYLNSFVTKKVEEKKEEVKTASKEDPNIIKKKLDAEKGNAKATTAAQSVKKYETNETSLGIDVSYANGKIDWAKVKASGIKFAIIRCGFRGHGTGSLNVDARFYDNMKGAIANDIQVGVYFFTAAINEAEAQEEARFVLNLIKDYDISYPVVYDTEMFNTTENYDGYRLKNTSDAQLTLNAIAFSNAIKSAGYTPMIYSSKKALTDRFDTAKFGDIRIWLAQYYDYVTYQGKYYMWQYTSDGSVPGISGRVDMNVSYFSVTTDASKQSSVTGVLNNNNLEKVDFIDCYFPTKVTKTVALRSTPYNNLPNKAGTLNSGSNITVTGINKDWIRFDYNEDTFYVNETNFYNNFDNSFSELSIKSKTNKGIDLYSIPYDSGKNVRLSIDKDIDIEITGKNSSFTRIKYNNEVYYVNDLSEFYTAITEEKNDPVVSEKLEENNPEPEIVNEEEKVSE